MYALNLAPDNRILSATFEEFAASEQPIVDVLPEGNINDYLFVNGQYVYDPMPDTAFSAETNIQKGKYFTIRGELYLAITNIPAEDKIMPGTNCVKTSMSEALNALNS